MKSFVDVNHSIRPNQIDQLIAFYRLSTRRHTATELPPNCHQIASKFVTMNWSVPIAVFTFLFGIGDGGVGIASLVTAGTHKWSVVPFLPPACENAAPREALVIFGLASLALGLFTLHTLWRAYKMEQTFMIGSPRLCDYLSALVATVFFIWCTVIASCCSPTVAVLGSPVSMLNTVILVYSIIKLAASILMICSIVRVFNAV